VSWALYHRLPMAAARFQGFICAAQEHLLAAG